MEEVRIKKYWCDLIYTGDSTNMKLTRCVPHDGIHVYEISGRLTKNTPLVTQCFLDETKKHAKLRYECLFGWRATSCKELTGKEAEAVLNDPLHMPLSP